MRMDNQDKVIVVTGASRGIGESIVRDLDAQGAKLVLCARSKDQLEKIQSQLRNGHHSVFKLDVQNFSLFPHLIDFVQEQYGRIDGLVNNAGIDLVKSVRKITIEDFDNVMNTNLKSAYFLTQKVGDIMIKQKSGSIVNISSYYGQHGQALNSVYGMSKAAMNYMTKVFALEWAKFRIRVNAVCPGMVETDMIASVTGSQKMYDAFIKSIPLKRIGKPQDVADAVSFLLSDKAAYMSGSILEVNGGLSAK